MNCNACNRHEDDADNILKNCSVCASVKYCSTDCQRDDWPNHKKNCTTAACMRLFSAIQDNDSATVARLAKTKRVLNGKVDYTPLPDDRFPDPHEMGRWTGLHQCVRQKNVEMMKILIENGANLEIKDVDGETPTFLFLLSVCSRKSQGVARCWSESERVRRGRLDMPHDGREGWRL